MSLVLESQTTRLIKLDKLFSYYLQAEHRQVVIGFGPIAEGFNIGFQSLNGLTGILELRVLEDIQETVITKLLLLGVLRLIESIGIDEKGVGVRYDASNLSDYIPNDLYFGADSMTVFMYKESSNERRTDSYFYDATNNRIFSQAIVYMQLTYADSVNISFIEQLGNHYYKSYYERMLPYELNARWNGSKPGKP